MGESSWMVFSSLSRDITLIPYGVGKSLAFFWSEENLLQCKSYWIFESEFIIQYINGKFSVLFWDPLLFTILFFFFFLFTMLVLKLHWIGFSAPQPRLWKGSLVLCRLSTVDWSYLSIYLFLLFLIMLLLWAILIPLRPKDDYLWLTRCFSTMELG